MAGAPLGNRNAAKAKIWSAAIQRALERREPADKRMQAIDELADKLLTLCSDGDLAALKELGDRLDGKPAQAIVGDNDADPINIREIVIRAVDAASDRPSAEG